MLKKNKQFSIQYFSFLTLLTLLVCAFNWIVNPYGIFANQYIPIDEKPAALLQMRMYKAHRVDRIKPKTIILGTSRAAVGFDPSHPSFKHQPVYNLALDGANIFEIKSYLIHANRFGQLREVVLSLDFMSFNLHMQDKPDFTPARLGKTSDSKIKEPNLIQSLFSYSALTDSLKTIFHRFDKSLPTMNEYGMTLDKALYFYKEINGGHHNTSRYSEKSYINQVYNPFDIYSQAKTPTLDHFADIVRLCHINNIKLTIVIAPTHVRHDFLLDNLGYWNTYEDWKRMLISKNETIAKEYHAMPFAIWDFTDLSDYRIENLPEIGDAQYQMKWFWETSHFNKQFGDMILNKINLRKNNFNFGVSLTTSNIDMHLQTIRQQKAVYAEEHPHIVAEMLSLTSNTNL